MRTRRATLAFAIAALCATTIARASTPQDEAARLLGMAEKPGGLLVHLGCGDGVLTRQLGRAGGFIVQGLTTDAQAVEAARRRMLDSGGYGRTSVAMFEGSRLPYVDRSVNVLVVDDDIGVQREEMWRVLAPLGVMLTRDGDGWKREVRPWPEEIDQWTHFLHGPDNNAVAKDRVVGPPRHLQWIAGPRHLRSHEHLNSVSALVSAGGRIFYVIDEGPTSSIVAPAEWRLVARDAFNGALLWKRDLGPWEGHLRLFRSGPADIARRLVAVGDTVYVTLGYGKQVAALDATSGRTRRVFEGTEGAIEIVVEGDRLFVLTGHINETSWREAASRFYPTPAPREKAIVALDARSGATLWRRCDDETKTILPSTMATDGRGVYVQNTREVIRFDAATGNTEWRHDRPVFTTRLSWSTPTLVVAGGVVLAADGSTGGLPGPAARGAEKVQWRLSDQDIRKHPEGDVVALSSETGEPLWTGPALQNFCSPGDVFVIGGRVFSGGNVAPGQMMLDRALDLETGAVLSEAETLPPCAGHTRCYRNKATERFLVTGSQGVEFVDTNDWSFTAEHWVRGTCQYGVMPCNGLLYVPPDSCACRPNARLHGFTAMAPARPAVRNESDSTQGLLVRGAAYDGPFPVSPVAAAFEAPEWPTYRRDVERSGRTEAEVGRRVQPAWKVELGGRLSSPTIACGMAFIAQIDTHTVSALDVETGALRWRRTVGARVDSPPTIAAGRAVFGCRDGWVYCLRASDGALCWRFRAAPSDDRIVALEQLESLWPVHGSVLVRDGLVWLAAGRSSYLDGGLHLYALGLQSGRQVVHTVLDGREAEAWTAQQAIPSSIRNRLPGAMPDILSASGDRLFMGWTNFTEEGELAAEARPHLFPATSFLDHTWWHRTYWQYGAWMRGGFGGWPQAARKTPAGRLLVLTDDTVFGFGRKQYDVGNPVEVHAGHVGLVKDGYQDIGRVEHDRNPYLLFATPRPDIATASSRRGPTVQYTWRRPIPIVGRGLVVAGDTLWIAGPSVRESNATLAELDDAQPSRLLAVSAADGTTRAEYPLEVQPVLDGMIAMEGALVISCVDGTVRCLRAASAADGS